MKPYDELPWWCQILWPWFGPPWYEQVEDLDAYLAAFRLGLTMRAGLAEELAGDDQPGEGYLAKAGRLTAARLQAEEIINHENGSLTAPGEDDEDGKLIPDVEAGSRRLRPPILGRGERRAARTHPRFRHGLTRALVKEADAPPNLPDRRGVGILQ